jgi:hypothetical protein
MKIPVFQFPWLCWKCEKEMKVTYPIDENILATEFKGNLAWTYSKTMGKKVVGNLCPSCGKYQGNFFIWDKFFTEYACNLEDYFVDFIDLDLVRCILCRKQTYAPDEEAEENLINAVGDVILQKWQDYEDKINLFRLGHPEKREAVRGLASGRIPTYFICGDCVNKYKDEIDEERRLIQEERENTRILPF